jgi:hypothetical protein
MRFHWAAEGAIVYVDLPWRISCADGKQCPIRMNVNYSENTSMKASPNNKKFERVVGRIEPQSRLLRAWELKGGVSAQVTALEIERDDGHTQKMIVRQHGEKVLAYKKTVQPRSSRC